MLQQLFARPVRGLNPIALGQGNPLFKPGTGQVKMRLLESRPLKTGCVLLFYAPEAVAAD